MINILKLYVGTNTGLLNKEDLGALVKWVYLFPLGPEEAIRLFPDGRSRGGDQIIKLYTLHKIVQKHKM